MEQHVKIIGIIDIVFGILAIIGGIITVLMSMVGAATLGAQGVENGAEGAAFIVTFGIFFGTVFITMGALQILVGVKLRARKSWARIVQIIFGIMSLGGFPVGTAFGVYVLWAMFNQDTAALFEQDQQV